MPNRVKNRTAAISLAALGLVSLLLCVISPSQQVTSTAPFTYLKLASSTVCTSSAAPALCSSAPAGFVALPTTGTLVVDTSAVTGNSQIFVQYDESVGGSLGVTCNSLAGSRGARYVITARTAATSFTISTTSNPSGNPACLSYFIVN